MSPMAKILVIGAQGALGRMCAAALSEAGFNVVRAGRRPEDKPDFRLVDLDREETVREACADADLVVTTVRHPRHVAERLIAREGGVLISLASLTAGDRAALKSEPARGLVVLHAGLAPGVYSLLLKDMLAAHPETEAVRIGWAISMQQTSGPAGSVDFMHPAIHGRGRLATRCIDFPEPLGTRRCFHLGGRELGFFGELAQGCQTEVYACVIERPAQGLFLTLNAIGLFSRLPIQFFTFGARQKARRDTEEPKRDVITLLRGDETIAERSVQGKGDYRMTVDAGVCFVNALLDRDQGPEARGVVGAEEIFDLGQLEPAFARRGILITPDHRA